MQIFSDKAIQREIKDLIIKCSYHDRGCKWTGELRSSEVCGQLCSVLLDILLKI